MDTNKITIIKDTFKNDTTGELTDGVTIIIDGDVKKICDVISFKENFADYTETIREILFKGMYYYMEEYKKEE